MKKKVLENLQAILTDFSQSKSDAVSIECSDFENLEKNFREYVESELGESFIMDLMEQMCQESLNPNLYNYWLVIKGVLCRNRIGLVEDNDIMREADEAKDFLAHNTLKILKVLCTDSGETPIYEDGVSCANLD